MYHSFLIHSSADGHLGCVHVLAIINSAAINIGVHVSLSDLVSSVCMPRWQVVAFHWVIGVLPLRLFGNCGKPGTVLQSEALVDSESKDPLVIKLSAYTSSDKGRRELGNHKHIPVPWFCSGWNHSNDEFMLVEHWSGDFINFFLYFFSFIFISWRLITLQYYTEWSKPER